MGSNGTDRVGMISIHAPLTGSDVYTIGTKQNQKKFQSTLPLRGATFGNKSGKDSNLISIHAPLTGSDLIVGEFDIRPNHFNPRSPYGERRH